MQMLFTGGFDVLCYELGPGKVMVTMQRGWNAVGVKDFLLEQPEVCCLRSASVCTCKRGHVYADAHASLLLICGLWSCLCIHA